jgi:NADH:ubiquinone oxidoreductase subunit 4 (subunit M)
MILAAAYLLWMFQRVAFGELSQFLKGLGHHLTDMTPTEILTIGPLAALVVVFGLFPGLILDLVKGSVVQFLGDAATQGPIAIAPQTALILVALPILYVVARLIWVARIDLSRPKQIEPAEVAS